MRKILIDTNIVLGFPNIFESHQDDIFYVHSIVAEEIDNQIHNERGNNELAYKARLARNAIKKAENIHYCVDIGSYSLPIGWDINKNDNKILSIAKDLSMDGVILCTNDLAMQMKADSIDLNWIDYDKIQYCEDIYKGYKKLSGDTDFVNNFYEDIRNGNNTHGFVVNEYVILHNTDTDKVTEERFDGEKFVRLKLPPSHVIKGLNSEQRCALDLLNNKNITIKGMLGGHGSGKTLLSLTIGLYKVREEGDHSRLVAIRSPEGEGKEIGYLKGDFDAKTSHFFKPIQQCLSGGEFEMDSLIQQGVLEKTIPHFLKGTTYSDCFMFVDEAEDLDAKQLKMIGTRVGKKSVIVLCGDYKQAIRCANVNNPLVKMCKDLKGHEKFGCVVLDEDVRSETSKIFANLWD